MKAWMADSGYPGDGCLLVFAPTRNLARSVTSRNGIAAGFLDEYQYIRCRRMPAFDKWYRGQAIIETNEDLPKECPLTFYSEVLRGKK